uniref:Translin-associated protein X n=1 Tax=Glossina pallidipes TaxID=7398 RepID=A0A1A9ZQ39_GLOPL
MSGRSNARKQPKVKEKVIIDENNPMLRAFRAYSLELDAKHDRYERIVKLSRDITIEAKRIIFLLHSIDIRKGNKEKVLEEAQQRLEKVIKVNFKAVAQEMQNLDPYQYRGAYAPGLQEFIEAYSFMEYMRYADDKSTSLDNEASMSDWQQLQEKMQYIEAEANDEIAAEMKEHKFSFHVEPSEYILGISDLSGELMRRCINSLGSGETDTCLLICKVLQHLYKGYVGLSIPRCRELSRKIHTMRQSVLKAEDVCYNVKVRGGEAAKWGLESEKPNVDIDEGFF